MRPSCSLLAVVLLSTGVVAAFGAVSPAKEGDKATERRFRAFGGEAGPVPVAPVPVAPPVPEILPRKWTDSTGHYSVRAEFVDVKDATVRLRKENGKTLSVPMDKLSKADQDYVRSLERPAPPPTKPEPTKPSGGRAINLSSADSGKTVSAGVGDLVIIELDANPTTGYSWEAGPLPEDGPLTLKSNKYGTAAQRSSEIRPMVGQGGVTTFTYQVVKTGKATIALAYRRPWEKGVKPAKTFTVTVEAAGATGKTGPAVTGKIVFSQQPDVSKISRIEVSIRNTALADGPAPLVGTVELKPPFELPVTFAVPYDPEKVRPNPMFYSLSARVYTVVGGSEKLYYINDTRHHVLSTPDDTKRDIGVKKLR